MAGLTTGPLSPFAIAKKSSREELVGEIASLERRARAESDFAASFSDEDNPWVGAGAELAAAKEQLAALDDHTRLAAFERLIKTYREACDQLRLAVRYSDRIAELEDEKKASRGYLALYRGAQFRNGPVVSTQDAAEREAAALYLKLEDERLPLIEAISNARDRRDGLEREHPFLTALGAKIDAEHEAQE